jgi:hypothetical protein
MTAQTFSYLWTAVLAFTLGWGGARLKDVISWSLEKRRRGA